MKILYKWIRRHLREEFIRKEMQQFEQEVREKFEIPQALDYATLRLGETTYVLPELAGHPTREIPLEHKKQSEIIRLSILQELKHILKQEILRNVFFLSQEIKCPGVEKIVRKKWLEIRVQSFYKKQEYLDIQIAQHEKQLDFFDRVLETHHEIDYTLAQKYLTIKALFNPLKIDEIIQKLQPINAITHPRLHYISGRYQYWTKDLRTGIISTYEYRNQILPLALELVDVVDEFYEKEVQDKESPHSPGTT